jgi:hypothetical protein
MRTEAAGGQNRSATVSLADMGGCNTLRACRERVAGVVSLVIGRSHSDNCRDRGLPNRLTMAQAPFDPIMTQGVAETLASRAMSGGVRELRATQQALGKG